eukprot:CAMPEP_0171309286 /NCGR_PEP_ID=MMETSP0816-20121228/19455_1 /TAXON_ID=420281 /ORGANISM="Proboscia inermis, Strain CCAP1064/1" /LENGTH=328 /DNA_ID=CAMNT_0011792733 /DNA_START=335 /DNA_END=1321 /DNA_ORIENTATION=+
MKEHLKNRNNLAYKTYIFLSIAVIVLVYIVISATQLSILFPSNEEHAALRSRTNIWVKSDAQAFNPEISSRAKNLVIVAGHSVIISGHLHDADHDEEDWYLLDYQKGQGLPQAIVSHIKKGIILAAEDPASLLVFSGGMTRSKTGPINEGESYFRVADALELWEHPLSDASSLSNTVRSRTVIEEFATDSFQNFLFSICRFKEMTGSYPQRISIVSFSFKRHRFEQMHAKALRWPTELFDYIGIDPPKNTGFDLERSTAGELVNSARPFENDPYGCNSPVLQQKRMERNPYHRTPPYELTCPELKSLLHWCGPDLISISELPWGEIKA